MYAVKFKRISYRYKIVCMNYIVSYVCINCKLMKIRQTRTLLIFLWLDTCNILY